MLKVGVYGKLTPPLDGAVAYSKTCEVMGFDAVAFTDQISRNHPNAAWPELPAAYVEAGLDYAFLVEHAPLADPSTVGPAAANLARLTELLRGGRGLDLSGGSTGGYLGVGDDA